LVHRSHNIDAVQQLTNLVYLAAGLYGSIVTWVVRWRRRNRPSELIDLLLPPLFLTGAFFVMFTYKFLRLAHFPNSGFTSRGSESGPSFASLLGSSLSPGCSGCACESP